MPWPSCASGSNGRGRTGTWPCSSDTTWPRPTPVRARPTSEIAEALGLPVTQVTNFLAYARREFRAIVLERLREISGTEAEFRLEAMELLGVDPTDVAV